MTMVGTTPADVSVPSFACPVCLSSLSLVFALPAPPTLPLLSSSLVLVISSSLLPLSLLPPLLLLLSLSRLLLLSLLLSTSGDSARSLAVGCNDRISNCTERSFERGSRGTNVAGIDVDSESTTAGFGWLRKSLGGRLEKSEPTRGGTDRLPTALDNTSPVDLFDSFPGGACAKRDVCGDGFCDAVVCDVVRSALAGCCDAVSDVTKLLFGIEAIDRCLLCTSVLREDVLLDAVTLSRALAVAGDAFRADIDAKVDFAWRRVALLASDEVLAAGTVSAAAVRGTRRAISRHRRLTMALHLSYSTRSMQSPIRAIQRRRFST